MQTQRLSRPVAALEAMRRYPKQLFYRGDIMMLDRPMVSIVGMRRASSYTLHTIQALAKALALRGVAVVSGAAMGVDGAAHRGAGSASTIAVLGNGLDIRYPAVHQGLIEAIEREGLVLSPFEDGFAPTQWSFVMRNEIVVALGEALIIGEADENGGTMHSARYALRMGKPIFVLPHRLGESSGTWKLVREGQAEVIDDIEAFASRFGKVTAVKTPKDAFYYFCQTMPTLDEALARFGERVYEAELEGIVTVRDGIVSLC